MPIESATYISDLVATNPVGATDTKATLDDHIRLVKSTLQATFPNVAGAVTPTHTELNYVDGVTSAIQTQINAKAAIASPTFTGVPAAPTAAVGTATTQLATCEFVDNTAFAVASGLTAASQAEMEAGTEAALRTMSPLRVAQAISAQVDPLVFLQQVSVDTGAVATGTTVMPMDDTIPQNTEGDEYMTLAITPLSASSSLIIEVTAFLTVSNAAQYVSGAIFKDADANALGAGAIWIAVLSEMHNLKFSIKVASGSTAARTYKFRAGRDTGAGTVSFNGRGGSRRFGGVCASSIRITEVL
jgi:hypothetical protein